MTPSAWVGARGGNPAGVGRSSSAGSYEAGRRPTRLRNRTASARHTLVRLAIKTAYRKTIHSQGWNGELTRRRLGRQILDLGNLENEADGIEFGYCYDTSPVICREPHAAPVDHVDAYTPGTLPGARPPSLFLDDGRAIFDLFGPGFTLLRFDDIDVAAFAAGAAKCGMPLKIVDIRDGHAARFTNAILFSSAPTTTSPGAATRSPEHPSPSSTACAARHQLDPIWAIMYMPPGRGRFGRRSGKAPCRSSPSTPVSRGRRRCRGSRWR